MTTAPWRIERLHVPASLEADDATDFIAAGDLSNLVEGLRWGNNDHWVSPGVRLAAAQPSPYTGRQGFVAKVDGRVVGHADVELPLTDNEDVAYPYVIVHPEYQRQSLGSELYAALEECMKTASRRVFMAWSDHVADFDVDAAGGVRPHSGPGRLPEDSGVVRFCQSLGYELEQVEWFGVLYLPIDRDAVAAAERETQRVAGGDYELLVWQDRCPDDVVDQYAELRRLMSIDIPLGELESKPEVWDKARVRESEEKLLKQTGHSLVAAVRHRPSNQLAGHTIVEFFPERPEVVHQEDTLVLNSHRGHRLGMLLKAHNLLRLQELGPESRRLYTWNAAENAHMLDINIALGFVPAGYVGAWQKKIR
ncbi:GNAT family N-acetyltransferase [Arthrobacter sp. H14]|uniref:GNAT family N-acetyltransferase n=1 Tax=Arthrobacter sp. H14 TaxID=1312959 RepID=UPI00047B7BB5|nr:GNAT family N-acetyltransferase [Arthrobacter sp. H14]